MAFIQLQVSRDKFLEIFREGLQKQIPKLLDAEFPLGPGVLLLDRVEVLPETVIDDSQRGTAGIQWEEPYSTAISTDVPRNRYYIVQRLRLSAVFLVGAGTPTPSLQALPQVHGTLRVEFDAWSAADWVPRFFLTPESFTLDPLPAIPGIDPAVLLSAKQRLERQIQPLLSGSSAAIQKDGMLGDNPWGKLEYINTGLAMDPQMTRVVILMQSRPDPEYLVNVWRTFHARQLDDLLQGDNVRYQWAQTAHSYILEQAVIYELEKFLNGKGSRIRATRPVQATWSNPGGEARISVFFPASTNAPDPFAGTIDFDIRSVIVFSAVPPNTLRIYMTTLVVETGEPFGMTMAEAGLILAGYMIPGMGAFTPVFLALVIGGLVDAMLGNVNLSPGAPLGMTCREDPIQNISQPGLTAFTQESTCEKPLALSFPVGGGRGIAMQLLHLRGMSDGMVMAGAFDVPGLIGNGFDIETTKFRWTSPSFPCGTWVAGIPLGTFDTSGVVARAEIYLKPHRGESADIRSARIVSSDPLRVVTGFTFVTRNVEITLRLDRNYLRSPYSFWILLHTTGGVRLIEIQPPPMISADDAEKLVRDALARSISDCYALSDPFYRLGNQINPKWVPDPQPGLRDVGLLWVVHVNGLPAGERVQVTAADGTELSVVRSSRRGVVPFADVLASQSGRNLGLQRLPSAAASAPSKSAASADSNRAMQSCCGSAKYLQIEQSVLLRRSQLGFTEPIASFSLENLGSLRTLIVATRSWVCVIDASDPAAPRRSISYPIEGLRGAMAIPEGLLAWGENGLHHLRLANRPARREHSYCESRYGCLSQSEIHRVCAYGRQYLVLTDSQLEAYDRMRCESVLLKGRWADAAVIGQQLFLLGAETIDVYDLAASVPPRMIARFEQSQAARLFVPALGPVGGYLYAGTGTGGSLWDVKDPAAPELVSSHRSNPFWASAQKIGSTVVLRNSEASISIHTVEASARI